MERTITKTKVLSLGKWSIVLLQMIAISFLFFAPFLALAQSTSSNCPASGPCGLIYKCPARPNFPGGPLVEGNCNFNDVVLAVKNFLDKIIILTLGFTVIVIAVAGYHYMISGANPGERAKANKMLMSVAIGIFFILAAWLIVTLIANTLLTQAVKDVTPIMTN